MTKSKNRNIVRTNIGSSERIVINKIKGLFYFDKENKYYFIKDGVIQDTVFDSLDELENYINNRG